MFLEPLTFNQTTPRWEVDAQLLAVLANTVELLAKAIRLTRLSSANMDGCLCNSK